MIANGLYDEGHFIVIAPRLNHLAQGAAAVYADHLHEPGQGPVSFANLHLETFIDALRSAGHTDYAQQLHRRYCDFWLVDGEIELALAKAQTKTRKPKSSKTLEAKAA